MVEVVIKRSGSKEPFDVGKIEKAVTEAAKDANVADDDASKAVRAVVEGVAKNAGDRTEVATNDIREWALKTLDAVNPAMADAWRMYDAKRGK